MRETVEIPGKEQSKEYFSHIDANCSIISGYLNKCLLLINFWIETMWTTAKIYCAFCDFKMFQLYLKREKKVLRKLDFLFRKSYICLFSLRSIKTNESKRWIKMPEFCEQQQQPLKSFFVCCGGKTLKKSFFQASTFSQESFRTKRNLVSSNSTWNYKILQFSRERFHFIISNVVFANKWFNICGILM